MIRVFKPCSSCNYKQELWGLFLEYENCLITPEKIACIHFLSYIIQAAVITIGNDGVAHFFKLIQIIDHLTAKEGGTVR